MEAQFQSLPSWLDVVAFDSEVAQDARRGDVLFVDVGGGNGSQCAALRERFPSLQGRIVLQDRPAVLENAAVIEGVEKMAHNFLTEQPLKSNETRRMAQGNVRIC
jgi:ribosomal protein RSM22 (predicted rRNA methylase)